MNIALNYFCGVINLNYPKDKSLMTFVSIKKLVKFHGLNLGFYILSFEFSKTFLKLISTESCFRKKKN